MKEPEPLTITAPAKLNLILEVLGKRPDRYHDIASIVQTIGLADSLTFTPGPRISLSCDDPALEREGNLALQAAYLLQREMEVEKGAHINLVKKIPLAAGLGGGSSDAAAALKGLSQFWGLNMNLTELWPMALQLGSDVPFLLRGGTALITGRGERVDWLPPLRKTWVVLAVPDHSLPEKTGLLYRSLTSADYTKGDAARRLADAVRSGEGLDPGLLRNAFEKTAFKIFPHLQRCWKLLQETGADSVHLSGSGPSLFALTSGKKEAEAIADRLFEQGVKSFVAHSTEADRSFDPPTAQ